eukprot:6213349-Pleurochrysis_carterae.AAC.6
MEAFQTSGLRQRSIGDRVGRRLYALSPACSCAVLIRERSLRKAFGSVAQSTWCRSVARDETIHNSTDEKVLACADS